MNGEILAVVDERVETTAWQPMRNKRLMGLVFGITLYAALAAIYFLRPTNPVLSLGRARFTIDAILELLFTFLALPAFGMAYFHGIRHYDENPGFAMPDLGIDILFVLAVAWVAVGNGIHLTAKVNEQMIAALSDGQIQGLRANFHWIRQELGHVFPHIGWQVLFAALMLGQIKRPYRGKELHAAILPCGIIFGLLFAQGAIAASCTHLGFILTAISCLSFAYLSQDAKLPPGEIPILKFFFSAQVTFLLTMVVYWQVLHARPA